MVKKKNWDENREKKGTINIDKNVYFTKIEEKWKNKDKKDEKRDKY